MCLCVSSYKMHWSLPTTLSQTQSAVVYVRLVFSSAVLSPQLTRKLSRYFNYNIVFGVFIICTLWCERRAPTTEKLISFPSRRNDLTKRKKIALKMPSDSPLERTFLITPLDYYYLFIDLLYDIRSIVKIGRFCIPQPLTRVFNFFSIHFCRHRMTHAHLV